MEKELCTKKVAIKKSSFKKFLYLFFTLILSVALSIPQDITWARDRENYLVYAHSSWIIMQRYIGEGILSVFSNEPFFLIINILLEKFFSPTTIIRIIIFSSAILVLYSLGYLTKFNFFVIILFLLLPQVIKNHIIHLRQGLALGIYLLSFIPLFGRKRGFLRIVASLIHTSVLFLVFFELMERLLKFFKLKFGPRLLFSSLILIMFIQSIPLLTTFMQDRRAQEYSFSMASGSSGGGIMIWTCIAVLFIMTVEKKEMYNIVACYGLIFYIASYFFLDFGARVFENVIPLIIVAILNLKDKYSKVFLTSIIIIYGLLNWISSGVSFLI